VLTKHRENDVDLGERSSAAGDARAGLVSGAAVEASSSPPRSREDGRQRSRSSLAIADGGGRLRGEGNGTGLWLVRDELGGTLAHTNVGGLRAEVIFPA